MVNRFIEMLRLTRRKDRSENDSASQKSRGRFETKIIVVPLTPTLSPRRGGNDVRLCASQHFFDTENRHVAQRRRRQNGSLMTEILVAMAILSVAILPLSVSFMNNQMGVRRLYYKAVAMEVIDGEMEILAAGEWHSFKHGAQPYLIDAKHARNLPRGTATLTITGNHLRLEWTPEDGRTGKPIVREATVK
jgi:hypothetical protein